MFVGRKILDDIGGENDDEDVEEGEGMGGVKLFDFMVIFGGVNVFVEDGVISVIGLMVCILIKEKICYFFYVLFFSYFVCFI